MTNTRLTQRVCERPLFLVYRDVTSQSKVPTSHNAKLHLCFRETRNHDRLIFLSLSFSTPILSMMLLLLALSTSLLFRVGSGSTAFHNIAPELGVATAASSWSAFTGPEKAIDGNTNGRWIPRSNSNSLYCSKTPGPSVWLKISFPKQPVYIDHIVVWNRVDYPSYRTRIDGVRVMVDDKLVSTLVYTSNSQLQYPINNIKKTGSSVTLWAQRISGGTRDGYLNFGEVEVFKKYY